MDEVEFFQGHGEAHSIYRAIREVVDNLASVETRVSKSQIGFYRKHPFASVWRPVQYLRGERPPLVLTVFLRRRDMSPRWKQVVEPKRGRFTHHVELRSVADVDHEVRKWLADAWREAA